MNRKRTEDTDAQERNLMADVVTAAQMKEIERKAAEAGLSYYQMMENAGIGAAEYIAQRQQILDQTVLVFCGKGNNGGDGFVVGRKLKEAGARVQLIMVDGDPKTEDAYKNKKICEDRGIPILAIDKDWEEVMKLVEEADLMVDAIYGTGFHGELKEHIREATRLMNEGKAPVYALDLPTGLNADTGRADVDTVIAGDTMVFHRFKKAHAALECKEFCGRLVCLDIGIEDTIGR